MTIDRSGRRYILMAFLMFALRLSGGELHAQEVLRMGYFDIPPHVKLSEDGIPKGAAVDYFETHIAPHLGPTVLWDREVTPPTRLMEQLRTGEKDAMIFLGKTDERTGYLHYPEPYLVIPEMLALKKGHSLERINKVSDLYGLTVGFLVGGRIPNALQDKRIKFELIAGKRLFERNIEKLLLGRIDAVYAPLSTALVNIVDDMDVGDQVTLVPIEFLDLVQIYTVFGKKTVRESVVENYNRALEAAVQEQDYLDYIELYKARQNAD